MFRIYIAIALATALCLALMAAACQQQAQKQQVQPFLVAWNYETSGYLEPCGCSANMLGGLPRRATVLEGLREKSPVLALEGAHFTEESGEFQLFKGETIVQALNILEYDGMFIGFREAQQGGEGLLKLDELANFPLICANLNVNGQSWPTKHAVVEKAGLRIGLTGVSVPVAFEQVGAELPAEMEFTDSKEALSEAIASLKQEDVDFIAVALEGNKGWITEMQYAYRYDVNLYLIGDRYGGDGSRKFTADTLTMSINDLGKYTGIVTVDPIDEGESGFQLGGTVKPLSEDINDDPRIEELYDTEFKPKLKDLFFATFKTDIEQLHLPAEYCGDCHVAEYEMHAASKHALAMITLENEGQLYNPDCMRCHVVYDADNDELHPMNCVNCHTNITDEHVWNAMEGTVEPPEEPVTTYTYEFCVQCHDELNSSPFQEHWPQYVHQIYHGGDMSIAEEAAKEMGLDIEEPPPAGVGMTGGH